MFGCGFGTAQAAGPVKVIKVAVSCTGDDTLGKGVCLALKEKLRASKGSQLVDQKQAERSPLGLGVHLVSVALYVADRETGSAIAVTFTLPTPKLDLYLTSEVEVLGDSTQIDKVASALLAGIDKHSSEFLLNRPRRNQFERIRRTQ